VILGWSALAMADREAIFDHIELESPRAAVDVDRRIARQATILREHPMIGRAGRIEGTRELVVARLPYVIAYRILPDRIRILRVLHGAQHWPDKIDPTGED
jgi:toxin ParE1/3/4